MLKIKKLNRKNFKYREKKRNLNKRNEDRIKYCKNIVKRNRCAICNNKKKKKQKKFCKSSLVFCFTFHPFDYVCTIDCYIFFVIKSTLVPKKKKKKNHSFQFCSKEHIEIIITLLIVY